MPQSFKDSDRETFCNYEPENKIRMITATGLFDGHDASINIMRRLLQSRGVEVIHLGHNRSAQEVVQAALQEDVHAIALSSYQGGHVEYFKYIRDLLKQAGADHIKIFGGGGGVIVQKEIEELENYGISKIYSPQDGQILGLAGIIGHLVSLADYALDSWRADLPRALTFLEYGFQSIDQIKSALPSLNPKLPPVIGITGTGGAGKSSLTDELLLRFLWDHPSIRICVLCVDPSKRSTGGALLGDRIRMNAASDPRVFLRSFATRGSGNELAKVTEDAMNLCKSQGFDLIIIETSGIGQGDAQILKLSDISMYVMTPEYGASSQLEKIDMLDFADLIVINKFERPQAPDALKDVMNTIRRSRFKGVPQKDYPVYGTIASRFADDGVNGLFVDLCNKLNEKFQSQGFTPSKDRKIAKESTRRESLIAGDRSHYLSMISKAVRKYHKQVSEQCKAAQVYASCEVIATHKAEFKDTLQDLKDTCGLSPENSELLKSWSERYESYQAQTFLYQVRGKDIKIPAKFETLSHLQLPKVAVPPKDSPYEFLLAFLLKENLPGEFPYTAGVFPFRRTAEDPVRMFAGEGGPHRTNHRFKLLSKDSPAVRLSTAFDSVTLYGADPDERPDIYGKVGESGVSIATLQDMKDLYAGFDLSANNTSVSMTINGPAPIVLALFLNAAIDQNIAAFERENNKAASKEDQERIRVKTLEVVRGTVQADILKEDQAQNTCIFSTEFALKLMADIQEYFIQNKVRNYYSVSISGYHIAEAGANPITQAAFTLANGFTYVEYYLARGMDINDFAPNLSFFFSNGVDAEYAVIGRVARRIWAIAMRNVYGADEKSQKLKYHIQTSGRSLHAQEIDFNDIRTTLQALLAFYDNCNSLHTNAYDEAITTPTEDSVRRALAIQMIITNEFGPNKCENINQGSFFISELTDLVEEAVLEEFDRLSQRGGVLGAMELQYQRNKIQEESLYYESQKDSGELPIVGVNTFKNPKQDLNNSKSIELARASYDEKNEQIKRLRTFQATHKLETERALQSLARVALSGENIFAELMDTVRVASLGQITDTLYRVGGKYRRSM
jgi:isobutyryl-CoA mutase